MRNLRSGLWGAAALALMMLVTSTSCMKAPILAVDGLRVGDMGITGVALDVLFRVRNPNPEPLNIDRFEYQLSSTAIGWGGASSLQGCSWRASARGRCRAGCRPQLPEAARRHPGRRCARTG